MMSGPGVVSPSARPSISIKYMAQGAGKVIAIFSCHAKGSLILIAGNYELQCS